ncbi:MAG: hypothetical protein ACX93T_00770 [Bacteroidota bacterium]
MTALQQLEQRSEQRGLQKGRQEGIQQGKQEGIQQGRQEGIEKRNIEIARNMLSEGLAFNLVRKLSGLSEEVLMKLKEEVKR